MTVLRVRQIQKEKTSPSWMRTLTRGGTAAAPSILTSTSKVGSAVLPTQAGKGLSGCPMDTELNTLKALRRRVRI
jgi:hypothetical protein